MQTLMGQFRNTSRLGQGVLLLFLLAPLLVASVRSGGSLVYSLLLLMSLFLAWPAWRELKKEDRIYVLSLLFFMLSGAVSLFFSDALQSEGFGKFERHIRLASTGLIFMLLIRLRLETGMLFLVGAITTGFVMAGQGFYDIYYLGKTEAQGPYYEIAFSAFGVLSAVIASSAALTLRLSPKQLTVVVLAVVGGLVASYLSGGRGSWIALPPLALLFAWLLRDRISFKVFSAFVIVITVVIVAAVSFKPKLLTKRVDSAVSEVQEFIASPEKRSSVGNRLNMWRNSLIIWSRNPVFGTGVGDFKQDSDRLVDEGLAYNKMRYTHPHSIYFDSLAMTGAVGLLAMLWALILYPFKIFYGYWKSSEDPYERFYALAGMSTITVYAIAGLTETWYTRNIFVSGFVLTLVAFWSSLRLRRDGAASGAVRTAED